jgi:hypothetical protein
MRERGIITATRQSAAAGMQMRYPQIVQQAMDNMSGRLTGEKPKPLQ